MNRTYILEHLAKKTLEMREAQKQYFATKHKHFLDLSKKLEREVDQLLELLSK